VPFDPVADYDAFVDGRPGPLGPVPSRTLTRAPPASLGRKICHGNRGQIRQAYREGQEDQLAALGLVLNTVVLWNTRYFDAIVEHLRGSVQPVRDEDIARLSPLGHAHLNCLGRYAFTTQPPAKATAAARPERTRRRGRRRVLTPP
jgi:hypothetical protein